jgi:hypothetical protein
LTKLYAATAGSNLIKVKVLLARVRLRVDRARRSGHEQQRGRREKSRCLIDLFEGAKGRRPKTDRELEEWLTSAEGKAATAFESTSISRWGETGRS